VNQPDGTGGRNLPTARIVVALVIIAFVLWFGFANAQRVSVHYIFTTRRSRLIYVILGSALLGAIADRLLRWRWSRRD
jgi:uncharacterized integral membrane protein